MIIRPQTAHIFIASGYFGLFVLFILLLFLASPTNTGLLKFDTVQKACDPGFVSIIATMLDLKISTYVLQGLFVNGAAFALLFSTLSLIFYKMQLFTSFADHSFDQLTNIASWKLITRYCGAPGIFCIIAVVNAYLCYPVGFFLFARWLTAGGALLQYFLAGLLALALERQIIKLASDSRTLAFTFAFKALGIFFSFIVLAALWPDMGSPLAAFAVSCVHNTYEYSYFGSIDHSYHSNLPESPLAWDAVFMLLLLFATGATQLGSCRLVVRSVTLEKKFYPSKLFQAEFLRSVIVAIAALATNFVIIQCLFFGATVCQ